MGYAGDLLDTPTIWDAKPETVAQTILHTVLLLSHAVIEDVTITPSAGALYAQMQ